MPRYEDVTQDGRVQLSSLMVGLTAVWRALAHGERMHAMVQKGILPILNRIVMVGEAGPFAVHAPIHVDGTWRLTRERAGGGDRLFLAMWLDAYAAHGQTHGPPPGEDAERVRVGRVYAEHVITRPFASTPAERKVTRLEGIEGIPEVPEDEHPYEDAASLLGALGGAAVAPARDVVFGLLHTDPNQHVNSLVYPRLFEEVVVAQAIEQKLVPSPERLLAQAIELRYRKPSFAGERSTISTALQPGPTELAAVGSFAPAGADPSKPSTTVAMILR